MPVTQTAAVARPNPHSVARNAFVFVLNTDNFRFILRQYSSASEHIHNMFPACLLTVHTSEHHVLGCRVRLCGGICSIVYTGLKRHAHVYKVLGSSDQSLSIPKIVRWQLTDFGWHLWLNWYFWFCCTAGRPMVKRPRRNDP